jgi:hypothetical protein
MKAVVRHLEEQAAQIQKISAQIELGKLATETIRRNGPPPQPLADNQ